QAPSPRKDIRDCSADPLYLPPTATNTSVRLAALRGVMRTQGTHAYIVPSTDAHMSEYISERDARLGWLTGFSGSAGEGIPQPSSAALWRTGSATQLSPAASIESIGMWILKEVPVGGNVTLDPFLFSIDTWNSYSRALHGSGRTLLPLETNLVDQAWGDQRPLPSSSEIYSLPAEFTGSSWQEKVAGIRQQMEEHSRRPTAVLLSGLEETAWLFNLRGDDIPYNPVFYSYTLLTNTTISLFMDESRLSAVARASLLSGCPGLLCVELQEYGQVSAHLRRYTQDNVTVWLGTEYTTYGLYSIIPQEKLLEENYSPVMTAKAVKNAHEQEMLRAAHVRDAVAVIQYLLWLEKTVPQGQVDEFSGAQHIDALRWSEHSRGPSFQSISASGLNAALAHYSPSNGSSRALSVREMYLFDTGGQYLCGCQTQNVESFARRALWNVGLNYGHGTGHGIGNFLSVHEWTGGSPGYSWPSEPGYYRDGEFGIRIEDVALVVEAQTEETFLTFEVVSLVPYDRKLIDLSLLSPEQIQYLNSYYEKIRAQVGPELRRQRLEEEYAWLQESTEPFPLSSARTVALAPLALAPLLSVLLSGLGA
uniref:X-prolyl aminopeptidase 2 n=1 Tax=Catharus ustulatus TaxID=91951 RepID=A0A8C3V9G1_CATUS